MAKIAQGDGRRGPDLHRPQTGRVLDEAEKVAKKAGDSFVPVERMLTALAHGEVEGQGCAGRGGGDRPEAERRDQRDPQGPDGRQRVAEEGYDALKKYARDLTEAAREGKIDPIIGRDEEIRRAMQVLCRRTKNNPVLIGEPGVGKTAIAEGLALRIVEWRRAGIACATRS